MQSSELDHILRSIEDVSSARNLGSDTHGDPFFLHNFGVFSASSQVHDSIEVADASNGFVLDAQGLDPGCGHPDVELEPLCETDGIANSLPYHLDHTYIVAGLSGSDTNIDANIESSVESSQSLECLSLADNTGNTPNGPPTHNSYSSDLDTLPPRLQWQEDSGTIVRNPSPKYMPDLERFLIHHYSNRVVHLFCVIDNKKSPWKTIHLPRVLQSAGELCVYGSTPTIRMALRSALLSVSAFYLANDSRSRHRIDDATRWVTEATRLRGRTLKLLQESVDEGFCHQQSVKYKDILATMLSMITINVRDSPSSVRPSLTKPKVMSGDTGTCKIHLDGAHQFMNHARIWKSKFSPKARSLHQIYVYLRVIYESTAIRVLGQDAPVMDLLQPHVQQLPASVGDSVNDRVGGMPFDPERCNLPEASMSAYECIYGVPRGLLILLARTIDLIDKVTAARESVGIAFIPGHLVGACDSLEKSIMDWPVKTELRKALVQRRGISSEIIYKSSVSFHSALIIYFAQNIRLLGHRYLQPYVQTVIENIEEIEQMKAGTRILAAPLHWPAFIAASEVTDEQLQHRFRKWYDQVGFYEIAAVRSGIEVLQEVWKANALPENSMASRWRTVVKQTGTMLMLS